MLGIIFLVVGLFFGFKVLYHFLQTGTVGLELPSAVLTVLLLIIGVQTIVLGLLADMLKTHRNIQDEILYRLKSIESSNKKF